MSLKNLSATTKIPKFLKNKLNNKKIYKIYQKFKKSLYINENFAVGVSGGPDSLALAFLAKIYALKKNLTCRFFIVDHKLRTESSKEARVVKKVLKLKEFKKEIVDKKRINFILKKIHSKSKKLKIDPKITNRIWKHLILSYIDYETRNFKKK